MTSVFLHLLNMSITAGWLVLAVVLLRLVFRRAPKWIHCLLWVLVAVRLLCPVSIESVLSLIPSAETVPVDTFLYDTPSIHSGVPVVDAVVNPVISNGFAPTPENSVNPMQVATTVAAYVWVAGIAAMLLYAVISTLRLRWQVREAAFVRENIWQCDRIATPFILGIFRPRIYLPTLLGAEEAHSVVAHEQAHLSRKDHWWKPLGFLLLTVYWFNPLLWVGYILLCRDIEAACDQRVVRNMDAEGRKEYSRVLLACSAPRHLVSACPLAFGETGVKSRIKSVLNYKKPAFWLVITAIVATVVAAVCLLTNPTSGDSLPEDMDTFLSQAIIDYNRGEHTGDAYPTEAHTVFGYDSSWDRTTVYAMVLYEEYYVDENGALQVQSGSHCPTILTIGKEGDSYTLLEYWTPRDGENYPNDIRDRFPARHRGKAMDTDGYYKGHHATTYQKAREHFEPWQTALHQAILANNRKESDNVFATESHRVYGATESEYTLTVYALVHYQEYQMVDGILTERSGSLVPTAITFTKNGDTYDLLQYWIPGDNWADSIREKFPEYLWDKALDYKNYPAEELKAESLAKAQAYFGVGDIFNAPLTFSSMNHLSKEKNAKLYANLPATNAIQYLPVIPMTNRGELDAFIAEYKEDMNFDRAEGDGLTPIHQMSFYDDAFFADHVLLAVYYADGSCSVQPKIGGVVYEPTGLQVQVDVYEPEAGDTALGQWFMLCEIKRAAAPNVQNYTAVVRSRIPMEGINTFTGRVTQVTADGKQMLMDCYDTDKFTQVWVSLQNIPNANPQVGDEYVVTHDQWVLETYPPRVTAASITPVSSIPTVGTTTTTTTIPTTTTTAAYVPNTKKTKELTEQQKGKIVADFAHYLWYDEEWYEYESVEQTKQFCAFRAYYGTYNGYMAVQMGTGFGPAMMTEYNVAEGYYFLVDGDEHLYMYRDGKFIGMSGAYASGLITEQDLKDIWYYSHGGKYPVKGPVYGMDITPNTAPPTTTTTTGKTTTTVTIIPENPNISLPLQHVSKVETIPNGKKLSVQPHTTMLRDTLPLRFSKDGLWVVCVSNMTQLDAFKKSMLDSYAESLSSFDEEYRNRSVDEKKTEIEQAYSQYDAPYFNTKSLVMVFLPYISSSLRGTVTNFVRQGNEICIDWIYHFPKSGAVSDDVNPRYMLVEMKTEDLIGVEKWSHHKTIEYY